MTFDLKSLVASLPLKIEQKRDQELQQRRQQILERFPNDTLLSKTKDPRKLNSAELSVYIIRCLGYNLEKNQIVDLFFGDEFLVDTVINILGLKDIQ